MPTIVMTYCAARKDESADTLPARRRYLSERIDRAAAAAVALGLDLHILSGKFGLLAADDPVPWYDHLLTGPQVPAMAERLAASLTDLTVDRVLFVARTGEADPGAGPYVETVRQACEKAGADFVLIELR